MYTGYRANSSINKSNVSGLNETQLQALQKQVDTYTRKLQVQKRKFFAIQDQHKTVMDQYSKQKQQLNRLKKSSTQAKSIIQQAKAKNLQATLQKAVSAYDDTIAYNNRLKQQIDMLRRQKKNFIQMQHILQEQLRKIDEQTVEKMGVLAKKKQRGEELKEEINQARLKNQQEREEYLGKFNNLEKEYFGGGEGATASRLKNSDLLQLNTATKPDIIDTQPLLKFRLKGVIASNKQKQRLIDQYTKHMTQIQQAFNQIKLKSNIKDLDQITSTFIKSQEQNYSLYNYMDELVQSIDKLEEENRQMEEKIRGKMEDDQLRREGLLVRKESDESVVSVEKRVKEEGERWNEFEEKDHSNLVALVNKIRPVLQSALIELSHSPVTNPPTPESLPTKRPVDTLFGQGITDRNIQQYLSQLQHHIHLLQVAKQQAQTKTVTQLKDNATMYSKPIPAVNYQQAVKDKDRQQQKDENKFWDKNKFRQYAVQFWQKRKAQVGKGFNQFSTNQQLANSTSNQPQNPGNLINNYKQTNVSSIANL